MVRKLENWATVQWNQMYVPKDTTVSIGMGTEIQ